MDWMESDKLELNPDRAGLLIKMFRGATELGPPHILTRRDDIYYLSPPYISLSTPVTPIVAGQRDFPQQQYTVVNEHSV